MLVLIFSFLSQTKVYALDFILRHNAQMMQEMTRMRSSIMRRNAQLVDWLVQHVGSHTISRIPTTPCLSATPYSPIPTEGNRNSVNMYVVIVVSQYGCKTVSHKYLWSIQAQTSSKHRLQRCIHSLNFLEHDRTQLSQVRVIVTPR